ncbi:uncharacterized protein TNCV_1906911 [Trichonephila clavipes]|nr:uncharacterized protein TNCV_1906911 [Trichonephila clavipes]
MINGRTRLHVVANGTMTGQQYIDEVLLPHVRLFRGAVGDKFVFMDDNATCHRTLAVQDCLDSEGIQRLVWPDLNPIENVWDALGRQVAGRNYPPTNKNTLIRALTEEWDKLPQQLLDNVVQSMWTQRHLDEIWKNLSPEERKSKLHLFEKTKRKVHKTKCSKSEQEKNYSYLLRDVEDAMLAEEPKWRYVSAPLATRVILWILRAIPETWSAKLMARFHPNFEGENPGEELGDSHLSSSATNLTRGHAARRLLRVRPCHEDTIHLQTSMSSPGFEPRPYGTAVSVANHCTGWATRKVVKDDERSG